MTPHETDSCVSTYVEQQRGRLMACKLYADGFPPSITEKELADLFARFGPVHSVQIAKTVEREPIGCAEIEMAESKDALKAVEVLHRTYLHGRLLLVFSDGISKNSETYISVSGRGLHGCRCRPGEARVAISLNVASDQKVILDPHGTRWNFRLRRVVSINS